jgi:hypothetical protein
MFRFLCSTPCGLPGSAPRSYARGVFRFDLTRCTAPMLLMPSMRVSLCLPKRIGTLLDPLSSVQIHRQLPHSPPAT